MKYILMICGLLMAAFTGCTSVEKMYNDEVRAEVEKYKDTFTYDVFTELDIQHLPEPVRKYFRRCDYIGKEKMINAEGDELTVSALITLLAEVLFIPNYALQEYIEWTPIDDHRAQATIRHEGHTASGTFDFDDEGFFRSFESNDRFYLTPDGRYEKRKFSVFVKDYKENNDILIPATVSAVWHLDHGEYEYWRGTISHIRYNIH
jgi:hypothetical protein